MMKHFKKVLSILCAIALLATSMTLALAEETDAQPAAVPAAEEAPASEAEYEIVATDDTVAEQFAEAVEGVAEAAEEKAEEAAEAVAEAVEEKTEE